jgi:uncharacterized membrane protein YhaH (DUF805 family)
MEDGSVKMTFADFWRPTGTISRGSYALIGLLGFALKHNLDRLVAGYGFHRPWTLFNYWVPLRDVARVTELSHDQAVFLGTLVILSLPFIWVGVVLTMKRLRSAGFSTQLVALFFLPFLNLLFFLILCLAPERDTAESNADNKTIPSRPGTLQRIFPENPLGSAAISLLLTVPLGLGAALLGTQELGSYGWGLFVAIPFTMGFGAALVYGIRKPRTMQGCIGVACLAVILLGAALFALAFEGMVCVVMAAPIALPLAAFGGLCAYGVQRRRWFQNDAPCCFRYFWFSRPAWSGWSTSPPLRRQHSWCERRSTSRPRRK